MGRFTQIKSLIDTDFKDWGLTNYKKGYAHLTAPSATVKINEAAKDGDGKMQMRCFAPKGVRKSTKSVKFAGGEAFKNNGGSCTTTAFAVVYKLLESGITDRIEIIGQGSLNNGHMWVVVGRTGGFVTDGVVKRPANRHGEWGSYIVIDVWLKAFGWAGVWKQPDQGKHHFFIENDINALEITYDSLVPEGDDA